MYTFLRNTDRYFKDLPIYVHNNIGILQNIHFRIKKHRCIYVCRIYTANLYIGGQTMWGV